MTKGNIQCFRLYGFISMCVYIYMYTQTYTHTQIFKLMKWSCRIIKLGIEDNLKLYIKIIIKQCKVKKNYLSFTIFPILGYYFYQSFYET